MPNLLDKLLAMRDEQRERMKTARCVVRFKDLPWEQNRYGKMKWLLHPSIMDTAVRTQIMYILEISPGSRSGKIQHQGGILFYVWAGKGYTVINGTRHDWEEEGEVMVPVIPEGAVFQHFNTDPANPARLVGATPNSVDIFGVDVGAGFEILEDCPEYGA